MSGATPTPATPTADPTTPAAAAGAAGDPKGGATDPAKGAGGTEDPKGSLLTREPETKSDGAAGKDGGQGEPNASAGDPEYAFTLPEGVELDKELLGETVPIFKEAKVAPELAQKFLDVHLKALDRNMERLRTAHVERVRSWEDATRTDKDYGGAQFDANLKAALRVVDKYGDDQLRREVFDEFGVGSHPGMFRFLARIARDLSEDSIAGTQSGSRTGEPESKRAADILYTKNKE